MIKLNVDLKGLVHIGNLSRGYFITTIVNQAIPFLLLPLLTRYLAPAEYGYVALFTLYLVLSNSLAGVSISTVIFKYFFNSEKEQMAVIIGNSIIVTGMLSFCTLLIILGLYPFFYKYFQLPFWWLILIPFASFSFIVFSLGLTVMRNLNKVFTFGASQIGNTIFNFSISIILIVLFTLGWEGRVWGIVISYFISAAISFFYLKKNGYISFRISGEIFRNILKVVIPLIPNSFQMVIISQVGVYFIQYYYSKELLGIYSIGFQVGITLKLLIDTLNMSWTPYLYEQISNGKTLNKMYLTRMIYALIGVLVLGMVFIDIVAGFIIRIMTTPEYFKAIEFVPWVTLGYVFYGINVFLFPILIKNEQQKFISLVTFVNMIVMILLNVLLVKFLGYIGVVVAFCLINFFMFATFFWKTQKVMPLPWFSSLRIWK